MSLDVYLTKIDELGEDELLYCSNITHNLNKMADAVGIYNCLWEPESIPVLQASQLAQLLKKGLDYLKKNPEYYMRFNASNGWGTYSDFIPWLEELLKACEKYPEAKFSINK